MPGVQYNPFTYRGYYYDSETGLYYLNSRYYNPQWGRFLNADCNLNANGDILGFNMFAYCGNNPVMGYDPEGEDAIYIFNKKDLPIFGHAGLFLQDIDNQWYYTDYGYYCDHRVRLESLSKFYHNNPMEYCELKICNRGYLPNYAKLRNYQPKYQNGQYDCLYFEGDFSDSLEIAKIANRYGYGKYNFLYHNCQTYAQNLLRKGKCADPKYQVALSTTTSIIPSLYISSVQLNRATQIEFKSVYQWLKELCLYSSFR